MMAIYGYLRVSRDSQAESGLAVARVRMTVAEMRSGLRRLGLPNTPDSRAAVLAAHKPRTK